LLSFESNIFHRLKTSAVKLVFGAKLRLLRHAKGNRKTTKGNMALTTFATRGIFLIINTLFRAENRHISVKAP